MRTNAPRKPTALAKYLDDNELSPADFAVRVGADRQQIWRFATGRRGPSVALAVRIEQATGGAVPVASWTSRRQRAA